MDTYPGLQANVAAQQQQRRAAGIRQGAAPRPTGPPAVIEPRIFRWSIGETTGEEMTQEVAAWRRAIPADHYVSDPKYMCEDGYLIMVFGVCELPPQILRGTPHRDGLPNKGASEDRPPSTHVRKPWWRRIAARLGAKGGAP